jgi:hypothetical protein
MVLSISANSNGCDGTSGVGGTIQVAAANGGLISLSGIQTPL